MEESIHFYQTLFGSKPNVVKEDYAKWALQDPRANFSISLSNNSVGVNHLGIEVDSEEELKEVYDAMDKTEQPVDEEGHTICCYARSEKSWIKDPQGVEWEAFHTYGSAEMNKEEEGSCCEATCCSE